MAAESRSPTFQIGTHADGLRQTLVLSGDLDLLVASDVEAAVRGLCAQGAAEIVLDLRRLRFMDSSGLRSTLVAHELCQEASCDFTVIPGPPQVQALFEMTGLAERLPFQTDGEPPKRLQDGLLSRLFVKPGDLKDPSG
ncbi:MAG TPA: STAS domain-containing protein [Solirubrobacteraceae bacterium]|nr:STAS domain-containing protein [Solirubrobacteraceae bacterium]